MFFVNDLTTFFLSFASLSLTPRKILVKFMIRFMFKIGRSIAKKCFYVRPTIFVWSDVKLITFFLGYYYYKIEINW